MVYLQMYLLIHAIVFIQSHILRLQCKWDPLPLSLIQNRRTALTIDIVHARGRRF